MNCAVCLNTERAVPPKERLGILMRDPNWHSFDDDFVKSYPSIFGKYVGDFSVLTSNNLLLSLTVDVFMDGFIKRKSRIRIYWGLMNIFHFISARKFLCRLFSEEVTGGRRAWGNSQNDALEIERIILWLNSMRFQHRRLRPARRKFYHQVSKTLSLEPLERELSSTIARYQVREDARENSAKLNRVLTAVHQGRIEQGEVLRTLDAIRRVIRYNQALDSEQCGEIRDLSKKANKAIKSRMSVNQKLELTLPLLPAFLNYKFEVVKGSELDLEILRSEILEVWNDLLARA
jgi:hypothetical protein